MKNGKKKKLRFLLPLSLSPPFVLTCPERVGSPGPQVVVDKNGPGRCQGAQQSGHGRRGREG